ncbi:mitochondrial ribonuclease P catalytic subunit [Cottoperca gobio]|uniref:Mitochondrial ribonuclease P catalytic subunit n=1 Tax=Cottoperca gobio TaxID=56716 RepID=A0A6J2S2W7_COTGO|nr:mitochondrial ribonuclease P catalytic subunit [Cottoperca gobio]
MGSTLMLKVRMCLTPLKPFFHQGSFFTLQTFLCKSSQLPVSERFLCTRDTKPNPRGRQTDTRNSRRTGEHGDVKTSTFRRSGEDLWDDESSALWQRPSFPKSMFAAGTAKRTTDIWKKKEAMFSLNEEDEGEPDKRTTRRAAWMQPPDRPLSPAEWRKIKESLENQRFESHMMSLLLKTGAELNIAKSLLTFVAMETETIPYELLLRYLALCVSGGHDAEVFDVYDIMRGCFPALDTGASTLFIKSFSRTARWREAVGILNEVNKVFTPSPRNYGDIITAAMNNGDLTTAWALYDELIEKELSPHHDTWDALFRAVRESKEDKEKKSEGLSQSEHQERLQGILLYMRNNQIYPQLSLAITIKACFERLTGQKWKGSWTSPNPKGMCRCCGSELESIHLHDEEYQQLRDSLMTDVIQGEDVFKKTTQEELESFKAFVKRKPAFDVVIDGLNVANWNTDKSKQSETLLTVVSELERQGLTLLVLGRKHMLRPSRSWDRHNMNLIQQKAHCFFTENISEDDPFLLYACLHSGNHCRFVSRDMMRDHKACLPGKAIRRLFFKWQRGHQMVVDGYVAAGKKIRFQSILSYDTIIQTSVDSWHVPFDDTEDRCTYEIPQRWLCLNTKH